MSKSRIENKIGSAFFVGLCSIVSVCLSYVAYIIYMYIPVVAHSLYIALACIVSASVGSASLRVYISADLFCFVWYLCSVAVLQASSILGIHYCQRCNIAWFYVLLSDYDVLQNAALLLPALLRYVNQNLSLLYIYGRLYVWCMVVFTLCSTLPLRYVYSLLSAIADHLPKVNMTINLT